LRSLTGITGGRADATIEAGRWRISTRNRPASIHATATPSGTIKSSTDVLVGNFGDGHINAYDRSTGHFEGRLLNAQGQPLAIPGLWGLRFPTGSLNAVPGALYFTAGINDERDGLFGNLVPKG
jgi:uncharacterized protein (TIGR03118 family)